MCFLYNEKLYGEFIDFIGEEKCSLQCHSDKEKIKKIMSGLNFARENGTIKGVLDYVFDNTILSKPNKIGEFEDRISQLPLDETFQKDKIFYDSLMAVSYKEVINLHQYIEDNTPFSTKHGVKGAEFDNVLIIIDDSAWTQYNFDCVFSGNTAKSQFERTLNLLYVCCSRSKENLALITLSKLSAESLRVIESWFGKENVYDVKDLSSI